MNEASPPSASRSGTEPVGRRDLSDRRGAHAADGRPRFEWVRSLERFSVLASAWDELADLEGTPFSRHGWYLGWLGAFRAEPEMLLLWRDGDLTAALPAVRVGRVLAGAANVHTPTFRPLYRTHEDLDLLLDEVLSAGSGTLSLRGLPMDEASTDRLMAAAQRHRRLVARTPGLRSPVVDTTGDFDAWRAMSKKKWRGPLERYRRKMSRDFSADFDILRSPGELGEEFEQGLKLEERGWKGRGGTAILSHPETAAFYRAISRDAASRGTLSLSSISLDGRMVAFDLSLLDRGRLYLLKTAYDESVKRLSPGLVLRLSVIERCFESGLLAHELLGGPDPYKLQFSTSERRHLDLAMYRRRPAPAIQYGYRVALRPALRRTYRRIRGNR